MNMNDVDDDEQHIADSSDDDEDHSIERSQPVNSNGSVVHRRGPSAINDRRRTPKHDSRFPRLQLRFTTPHRFFINVDQIRLSTTTRLSNVSDPPPS